MLGFKLIHVSERDPLYFAVLCIMADWVHCNICFHQPGDGCKFSLTSCGHIFCDKCVLKGKIFEILLRVLYSQVMLKDMFFFLTYSEETPCISSVRARFGIHNFFLVQSLIKVMPLAHCHLSTVDGAVMWLDWLHITHYKCLNLRPVLSPRWTSLEEDWLLFEDFLIILCLSWFPNHCRTCNFFSSSLNTTYDKKIR